jgi:hypothetical protein
MREGQELWDKRFFWQIAKRLKLLQSIFGRGENRPESDWFYPHF